MTRKQGEALIWRHTHPDFKGKSDGVRMILIYRHGTVAVPLSGLTEDEYQDKLAYAIGREQRQKGKA